MNTVTYLCEKVSLLLFVICFSFVALYTPQPVHAGGPMGGSLEATQWINRIILGAQQGLQKISAMANTVTSAMTQSLQVKEYVLDNIAWALAKTIISQMTASILNWVNSGFEGKPTFVVNLRDTLLEAADQEFGKVLTDLGGPFSFICSPFQLDVKIAVETYYSQMVNNEGIPSQGVCKLSDALSNIENFIGETGNFLDNGGWDAWFEITSNPTQYTPLGGVLEGTAQMQARLVNAKGEKLAEADFGQGFLSAKVCQAIEGTQNKDCKITTPGKVINEALTFQTSTGPRSLIAADEFNEILGAVFSQLAEKAITGAAGLLGLSPGTGYTTPYGDSNFTDSLASEQTTTSPTEILSLIENAILIENRYDGEARKYEPLLIGYADDLDNVATARDTAREAADEIPGILVAIAGNLAELDALLNDFEAAGDDPIKLQDVSRRFFSLPLHSDVEVDGKVSYWQAIMI